MSKRLEYGEDEGKILMEVEHLLGMIFLGLGWEQQEVEVNGVMGSSGHDRGRL